MKKTLKAILAAMLATVMAFSSLAAFAADESDAAKETIKWDYYGDTLYLEYAGELAEGANTVTCDTDENDYFYFTFTAENAGFYEISHSYYDMDGYIFVPESYTNGKAYNEADGFWFERDNDLNSTLYYFEKGEQIIGTHLYYYDNGAEVSVDYYGESIESITTDELIKGDEVYFYSDYDIGYVEIYSDVLITFANDKTIECRELYCTSNAEELVAGDNTVTANICGKDYDFVIKAVSVTDYITDVEISNIEDYLFVTEYYNTYDYVYPYGETVTVTYTDGTKKDFIYGEGKIALPNGKEVWLDVYFDYEDDSATMSVYIADYNIETYECEKKNAPLGDNWATLVWRNATSIKNASYHFRQAIAAIISCYSLEELADYGLDEAAYYLSNSIRNFVEIFSEFFALIKYYLA